MDHIDLGGNFGPSEKYKNMHGFTKYFMAIFYICWSVWILEFRCSFLHRLKIPYQLDL